MQIEVKTGNNGSHIDKELLGKNFMHDIIQTPKLCIANCF